MLEHMYFSLLSISVNCQTMWTSLRVCRSGGNDVTVSNRRQYRHQSFATSCILGLLGPPWIDRLLILDFDYRQRDILCKCTHYTDMLTQPPIVDQDRICLSPYVLPPCPCYLHLPHIYKRPSRASLNRQSSHSELSSQHLFPLLSPFPYCKCTQTTKALR
jgi:hypothetical protein